MGKCATCGDDIVDETTFCTKHMFNPGTETKSKDDPTTGGSGGGATAPASDPTTGGSGGGGGSTTAESDPTTGGSGGGGC